MGKGEVGEISDLAVACDLISAGYIERIEPEAKPEAVPEEKPKKAARTRKK